MKAELRDGMIHDRYPQWVRLCSGEELSSLARHPESERPEVKVRERKEG